MHTFKQNIVATCVLGILGLAFISGQEDSSIQIYKNTESNAIIKQVVIYDQSTLEIWECIYDNNCCWGKVVLNRRPGSMTAFYKRTAENVKVTLLNTNNHELRVIAVITDDNQRKRTLDYVFRLVP